MQDEPGASAPYMQLQDTGRGVADQWQLRDDVDVSNWQPIEYERPAPPRTNWILPSLVGIMLLAVLGYVGWVGYARFGAGSAAVPALATATTAADAGATEGDGSQTDQNAPENQDAPAAAVLQETPTSTPEPTLPPAATATAPPLPEPTVVLVDQRIATITNQYGVNARLEPNTTSEVLRILEQGETAIVVDELTDADGVNWLQVQISEGALVWISADFAEITTQQVAVEPGAEPVATTPAEPPTEAPAVGVSVTVSSTFGLNARALPNADAEIITLLENAQTLPAVARSADNTWVQVQLDNGDLAWVFVDLVNLQGDLLSLPISSGVEAMPPAASEGLTSTATISNTAPPASTVLTDTATVTDTTPLAPAAGAPQGATIVVSSTVGVNARSTASTDAEVLTLLEPGTQLEAIGQNADGSWLQAPLADGRLAWVLLPPCWPARTWPICPRLRRQPWALKRNGCPASSRAQR
ncbi:MAG: SH3 domain-containing protein [Caldilineaceae bacterium]